MRILFFGDRCTFSVPPLEALTDTNHQIVGAVIPGGELGIPWSILPTPSSWRSASTILPLAIVQSEQPTFDSVANDASVPLCACGDLTSAESIESITALSPDLLIAACFPRRLPTSIRRIPRLGAYNIHPSLLPRWRGPDPIHWTLASGDATTGVTIHRMTERFDAGPIVAQRSLPVPTISDYSSLEMTLAEFGAKLLLETLPSIELGTARLFPQDEWLATWAPIP